MFVIYYYQYHTKIYSHFLYRTGGDEALAEDLTSETFLKAYQAFDRYDRQYAFSTWIYTIARNTLHDHWRKYQKRMLDEYYDEFDAPMIDEDADEIWIQTEQSLDRQQIMNAINQLSTLQQSCMILKHLDGFSNQEISEILEINEPAVRQHLSRGSKKIKPLLATHYQQ